MKRFIAILALLSLLCARAERGTPVIIDDSPLRSATIRCAGDFVIHDNLLDAARYLGKQEGASSTYEFAPMLSEVSLYLADADFTVTNVDGVMGGDEFYKKYGYSGYPAFSTPASLLTAIKGCGVDLLSLANNHALDYWYSGLKATIDSVDKAGLLHVGAYRTQEERSTPCIVDINGIKVGFFNYTDSLNMMDKRSALDPDALKFGVCFTEYATLEQDIKNLREGGAEVIVCIMHWGIEYRTTPCQSQINKAEKLAALGVDVIIGGHPHMVQKATYVGDTLCIYSLGNFLSDQRTEGRDCGIIYTFTLQEKPTGGFYVSSTDYATTWVWRKSTSHGYEYKVLLSEDYLNSKPAGMSDADYKRMCASVSEIHAIMQAE